MNRFDRINSPIVTAGTGRFIQRSPSCGAFQIAKAGKAALEGQLDGADGTVALFADNDLGLAVTGFPH